MPQLGSKKPKVSQALKGRKLKEKHWNWQGGITPIHNTIRGSLKYKEWEREIIKRDISCKGCGEVRKKKLVAHHILNFSAYPDLRFVLDNGILLCRLCHKEFHKKYSKKNNTREQIENFINSRQLLEYSKTHNNLILTNHQGGNTFEDMEQTENFITRQVELFLQDN